jgi:hypothetical protein
MTVLADIKVILEVDDTDTFDSQLLLYINSGLAYLMQNGIPVSTADQTTDASAWSGLKAEDYGIVRDWLAFNVKMRFDQTAQFGNLSMSQAFFDTYMSDLLYGLKCRYDRAPLAGEVT